MIPCKLIRHDSNHSWSKRSNDDVWTNYAFIMENQVTWLPTAPKNNYHIQLKPLLFTHHMSKIQEMRMSSLNKDYEIGFESIMCSKWSQSTLDPIPCFLLPMMIKYDGSMTMETAALLHSNAFGCFINKELVWWHKMILVKKIRLVVVEVIDGQTLFLGQVIHGPKVLNITIETHTWARWPWMSFHP
jgi:hypothetical protein